MAGLVIYNAFGTTLVTKRCISTILKAVTDDGREISRKIVETTEPLDIMRPDEELIIAFGAFFDGDKPVRLNAYDLGSLPEGVMGIDIPEVKKQIANICVLVKKAAKIE